MSKVPVLRAWPVIAVSRDEDVAHVLGDPVSFSSVRTTGTRHEARLTQLDREQGARFEMLTSFLSNWLMMLDPPDSRVCGVLCVEHHAFPHRGQATPIKAITEEVLSAVDEQAR